MPDSNPNNDRIEWRAPEFTYWHKGVSWYWLTIIVAVLLLAVAAWGRNFLFGVFVVIAEILVLTWGSRTPEFVTFRAEMKELNINDRMHYAWQDFASFSTEEEEGGFTVFLRFRNGLRPPLRIFIPRDVFAGFKKKISLWCPETQDFRSFVEVIEEFFRF